MAYLMREDRSAWSGCVAEPLDLLERMRSLLQARGYSARTARLYLGWIERLLASLHADSAEDLSAADVQEFMASLLRGDTCSEGTWNQARAAIVFLFRDVLHSDPAWLRRLAWSDQAAPTRLTLGRGQIRALLARMDGRDWLIASLIYGSGLHVRECLRLSVHDVDLQRGAITVRGPDGMPIRRTMLPRCLRVPLRLQIDHVMGTELRSVSSDVPDRDSEPRRSVALFSHEGRGEPTDANFRVHERSLRRSIERAAIEIGVRAAVSPRTLRDSFAAHLLQQGLPLWCVQVLCGHLRQSEIVQRDLLDLSATPSPLDVEMG